ncbi:MAG: anti-sigma factor [Actinobacteria bacterium]|nr:anti-sigma factor [Actinomycetota bacterium]
MAEQDHERFEELALGHVLGGLRSSDAAEFRAHLIECRDCRLRVAELRDIAADLAATEREEKRLAAVATQVAEREDEETDEGSPRWVRSRWIPAAAVIAIIAVLGILFWNYHLRRVTTEYATVVERQEEVLRILSSGDALEVDVRQGVDALAAHEGDSVALSVAGLPASVADGYLVVWLFEDGEATDDTRVAPSSDPAAFAIDVGDADQVVVSGHRSGGTPPGAPGDGELVRVDIPAEG